MQTTDFNEKIGEFYKCATKPLKEIAELNIETIKRITNTNVLNELAQAKKPEDLITANIKLVNNAVTEGVEYVKEACEIWLNALSQTGNVLAATARDVTTATKKTAEKTAENIKPSKL